MRGANRRPDRIEVQRAVASSEQLWRMVPFRDRVSEGERDRIDRIAAAERMHLGDVLSALVSIGLEAYGRYERKLKGQRPDGLAAAAAFPRLYDGGEAG